MVKPKMVYISNTTEIGTQYTKAELEALSHLCRQRGLYLFLDGARLGAALASSANDLTLADIAALTDVFYIGGTKNGALFGEAVVILNPQIDQDFRYMIKQRGGMLAKGWLLGIQFETLFTDGLFYEMAGHASRLADRLRAGLEERGFSFYSRSVSNQLFPIFSDELIEEAVRRLLLQHPGQDRRQPSGYPPGDLLGHQGGGGGRPAEGAGLKFLLCVNNPRFSKSVRRSAHSRRSAVASATNFLKRGVRIHSGAFLFNRERSFLLNKNRGQGGSHEPPQPLFFIILCPMAFQPDVRQS